MFEGKHQVMRCVLYALTATGPEGASVAGLSGGSDEGEETSVSRESFPSNGSTDRFR